MKKWLLILLLGLLLAAGAAVLYLDRLIASAIEKGGSAATGVPTRVSGVDAGFFQGHLGIAGLALDNPAGFSTRKFLSCEELRAEWDNGTILSDSIHVKTLRVRGLRLELERNGSGFNYQRILDALHTQPATEQPPAPSQTAPARQLVIDSIVLEDLRCGLTLEGVPLVDGRKELKLPSLELKGLKSDGDAAHFAGVVLEALIGAALNEIARSGADFLPKDMLKDVQGHLKQLEKELKSELKSGLERGLLELLDPR
jgi:hypothetical protein